ncbi:2-amino-4-hydroxy-6-hydroxymethyldihydropteridine diphosphokinase [Methylomagnum ishizawai]|uniref:2-amino-4-hydroxy-6- hydroxymethyldihydropteridine diphosphokinase n=1 Tax=Methylomagnum ishizawai TaxID=1760988 RepID=UPI001C3232B7|nr:2-amino-4-hydroxy-6-hydroxymethyldihydropteridine diphosphokinase [Methylomagnum ishizawai]BBL77006.1 2-amino-4-hydroxy-6-hydroxymethyldihydropteridine diphosphokinase [Methylomagnum ishizawai]
MPQPQPLEPVLAYIGFGGNLGDPVERLRAARREVAAIPGVRETAFSSLYQSAPMGPQDQPEYVNAVMAITTSLAPLELLRELQAVEARFGRVRGVGERWGPRTLDLDLLLYGQQALACDRLAVPHPGLAEREFVLYPLLEIAPGLEIPGLGPLSELARHCPLRGLTRIEEERHG